MSSQRPRAPSIAPPPVHISTSTLYIGAAAAFVVAVLAASLGVSYILCAVPALVQWAPLIDQLCTDDHYKYLVPLLVPTTAWFVIANWVGWEFFRNA